MAAPSPRRGARTESLAQRAFSARGDRPQAGRQLDEKAAESDKDGATDYFAVRERLAEQRLYQPLDQTKEWAENNYYRLPIEQQDGDLITVNDLWLDWARHSGQPDFRSPHFAQVRNFTEAMFALSILDLPNESPDHKMEVVEQSIKIQTAGPVIVLHEQIEPATEREGTPPVLVSQNFFRDNERYAMVNGEQVDRFVSGEFLYQTVYGCQLVITNPTSSRQKLDVLTQLPTGAMPVQGGKSTQTVRLQLEPYHTQTIEYYFYFPAAGDFVQFPAHVTKMANWSPPPTPRRFMSSRRCPKSIANRGITSRNSAAIKTSWISFKSETCKKSTSIASRSAWEISTSSNRRSTLLRRRHIYNHTLWSYAVHHNQAATLSEFLDHSESLLGQCGDLLISPLVVIDPVARKTYEHLEYYPLVNARAHQVGQQRQILNDRFHEQYHRWLKLVSYMRQLDDNSRLVTVYYLLLQDRIEEAIAQFQQIDPYHIQPRLQYDYCQAYLSMSQGETDKARSHRDRLSRLSGRSLAKRLCLGHESSGRNRRQGCVCRRSRPIAISRKTNWRPPIPSFDFNVEAKRLQLQYRNLNQVTVRYYLMDIELLFSRNPFVQRQQGQFSYIAPNLTEVLELPAAEGQIRKGTARGTAEPKRADRNRSSRSATIAAVLLERACRCRSSRTTVNCESLTAKRTSRCPPSTARSTR